MNKNLDYKKTLIRIQFITILFSLILFGCNEVNEMQDNITRIRVFKYEIIGNREIGRLVIDTQDSACIREYLSFMTNKSAPFYKCGYTGRMELLKCGGENIEIRFNSGKDCGHYVFTHDDRMFSKRLTTKGIFVLDSIINDGNIN